MADEIELGDEVPSWARNCPSGKQKFTSGEEARRIYRTEQRRTGKKKQFVGTMHTYECPQCGFFHYTHRTHTQDKRKY